ncbi:MAG TPA: tRNA pseudouridine(38-40) synthase TruA [Methanomicrobiales archaeon]|jgi:tRNA pseudouridine38-40 synthase|nr:tRNA pseudouridine(38-40) synthase TruA [Methanomicrobiales archaeon]
MRLAFRIAYLGDGFFGSQVQADRRTVEGEFTSACRRLALFDDWREARFAFAGRTDRGVHARGQVAAFDTGEPERAKSALNVQLPRDCWCTGVAEVPEDFHPRYDARSRTYRYFFPRISLDRGAMEAAAGLFTGRHDFSRLARVEGKDPVRNVISARVFDEGGFACFEVTAESFLWQMVRGMAGALASVGQGQLGMDGVRELLEASPVERFPPAPSSGLVLWEVDCGTGFLPMDRSPRSSAFLAAVRGHHEVMARVTSLLEEGR